MDETELRINLKALKNIDPYIIDIEEHSSQVALYKYQSKTGEWEKTDVEGTLFVYRRAAEPLYGFTIMNRLSMKNLVEPVTKQLDFQLQAPFLLYRNHQGDIFGIWFYEQSVCERVGKRIEELVKDESTPAAGGGEKKGDLNKLFAKAAREPSPDKKEPQSDASGQNLLRLLGGPAASSNHKDVTELGMNNAQHIVEEKENTHKTTASVADFFAAAKADHGPHQMIPGSSSAFTSVPIMGAPPVEGPIPVLPRDVFPAGAVSVMPISQGLAMGAVPVTVPLSGLIGYTPVIDPQPPVQPASLFQRLLSNPGAHSVESIERQQRSSVSPLPEVKEGRGGGGLGTPQKVTNPGGSISPDKVQPTTPSTTRINALETDLKTKLQIGGSGRCISGALHGVPSGLTEGGPQLVTGEGDGPPKVGGGGISVRSVEQLNSGYPPVSYQPSVPAYISSTPHTLLSPQVFSSAMAAPTSTLPDNICNGNSTAKDNKTVTPLTKEQMLQAVQHLLDTDDDFISKLHEAYVYSLNKKFKNV